MSTIRFSILLPAIALIGGWAQAADTIALAPSTATPVVGSSFTVAVTLNSTSPRILTSGQVKVTFDTSKLSFVSIAKDANAASATVSGTPNTSGAVNALLDYGAGASSSGTVLTITFNPTAVGAAAIQAIDYGAGQSLGCLFFDDAFATVDVTVPASPTTLTIGSGANQAPTVNAGGDQNITLPATATLDATVTDDGLPTNSLTHAWTKVSGPGTVTFANATAVDTTATFSAAGTYVLQLSTSDSALTGSDTLTVTVSPASPTNTAPVVNAGADLAITLPATASLVGSATDDGLPTPAALTHAWTTVSGPGTVTFSAATALSTTATFSTAGTYVLRLTTSDGALTGSDTLTVTVSPASPTNTAPVVNAGADLAITLPATASLAGSATDDGLPTPAALTHAWTTVSGPGTVTFSATTALNTTATFSTAGTYVLQLATSDGALTGSDTLTVTVSPASPINTAPVVNAGADVAITLPATASLAGSATDDGLPTPPALTHAWTTVSGPGTVTFSAATALNTTATFSTAGTYVLRLTTSDGALTGSDTLTVTVSPAGGSGNLAPTVNAGADLAITLPATATLSGMANDDGLPSGTLSHTWSVDSGPGTVTFATPNALTTTTVFGLPGTYVLRLTSTDGALSGTDTLTVTVYPVGTTNTAPVVNAGPDQTITLPAGATFVGLATDDGRPGGSTLTYAWTRISGPGTVSFATPAATTTSATFSAAGTYVLQLAASDSALTGTDQVTIVVQDPGATPAASGDEGGKKKCGLGGGLGIILAGLMLTLARRRRA